ncbi:MAG TPA: hypothetical protein VFA20_12090 [Myxococcaceae bacterium]|nr:hypothetical protein [Myxococcaceae bacterium]
MIFLLAASLLTLGEVQSAPAETPATLPAPSLSPEQPPPALATGSSSAILGWYGWQTLALDVPALALSGAGFSLASQGNLVGGRLVAGGIALYALGPPLVHLFHGRGWVGAGDLGLRVGIALLGGLVGGLMGAFFDLIQLNISLTGLGAGAGLGVSAGALGMVALDAAAFAWMPAPAASPPAATASLRWAPFASSVRGTPVAGLAGVF